MLTKRLKEARKKNKLTQEGLAKIVNTKKTTISNYETGYSTPSNEMLGDLADTLNVTTDYLLGRTNESSDYKLGEHQQKLLENDMVNPKEVREKILQRRYNSLVDEIKDKISFEEFKISEINKVDNDLPMVKKTSQEEKDIAKRMKQIRNDLTNDDGLSFDGEPMTEEAVESLLDAMEYAVRQTQRINKKYIPKKYRDNENKN